MKTRTFRALALPGILMACIVTAAAQVIGPNTPYQKKNQTGINTGTGIRPATPVVVKPATPAIVKPATPAITRPAVPAITKPATPAITRPAAPAIVTPATPGIVKPATPGVAVPVQPGVIIVPAYPSAWIGPTIVRETRSEPAPVTTTQQREGQPMRIDDNPAPHRLVALLGRLKCHDVTNGGVIEIGDDQLCIGVGALVGYVNDRTATPAFAPVSEGIHFTYRAIGDFFGYYWDGDRFKTSEDWKSGPFLSHPIMTVNEASPSTWEFEAAQAGRRIGWMRLAVALFEYDAPSARDTSSITFPRGRRASMAGALNRIHWEEQRVTGRPSGLSATDAYLGADVSYFGKALEMFASRTMTPSMDNDRIGIAEWFLSTDEINAIVAACPKFDTEIPTGARLRETRSAERGAPAWVRSFDRRGDHSHYTGEVWFIVVPDAALNTWLDVGHRSDAAGGRS